MNQPPSNESYVLRRGDDAARRLKLLARLKWPTTRTLFRHVGIRKGMTCLDVGCGNGAVTLRLALRVGSGGQAVGIDRDERCLELARQKATRRKLPAVFRAENILELHDESAYDRVYTRFVLTHLPKPSEALGRMIRAARPGGLVVVEDIEFASHYCYPESPAYRRYETLYQQVVRRKGGDPNIGPRLAGLLADAGLEDVDVQIVQPVFRGRMSKRLAAVTMEHIQESIVQEGLTSAAEVQSIVADLERFADQPEAILGLPRIFQVWGKKSTRLQG